MANGTFFTSWQLWEEMTFVLAMGIVIVFFCGLVKLWSSNRQMRKVELLDAEKQARVTQMRKSGLSANGRYRIGSEIPFGVKALEVGVEVDGIWAVKMASMASQPPNRKWSSRRKPRAPPNSLVEMDNLGSPAMRPRVGLRGSRRASKISRREIVEPSQQTREKLENMSLLEEERDVVGDEQPMAMHQSRKGPLGRIQKSLRKMTSLEMWQHQEKKWDGGRVDAKEFHERAQAKKPQRFYPESSTGSGTTAPLMAPKARGHATQHRLDKLLITHGASLAGSPPREEYVTEGRPTPAAGLPRRSQAKSQHKSVGKNFSAHQARTYALRQQGSDNLPSSSADSLTASGEAPKELSAPIRVPGPHARRSSDDSRMRWEAPVIPSRRSSRGSEERVSRQSSAEEVRSAERSNEHAETIMPPNTPVPRYPPNSSRSGPVVQRSNSLSQGQQQEQKIASTPPRRTSGSGEFYANTSRRSVNSGFEILPAGTFGQPEEQQDNLVPGNELASAAASVRSSIDSQRSCSGRRKLQKRTR